MSAGPNRCTQRRVKRRNRWWREWTWLSDAGWVCSLQADPVSSGRSGMPALGFGRTRGDAREAADAAMQNRTGWAGTPSPGLQAMFRAGTWWAWARRCGLPCDLRILVADASTTYRSDLPRFDAETDAAFDAFYVILHHAYRGEIDLQQVHTAAINFPNRTPEIDRILGRELAQLARQTPRPRAQGSAP